jgi:two-component system, OmpR family, sensor histidine kinase MprB
MSFRLRLTLVAAAAVALAILLASAVVYVVVRDQLRSEVDDSLRDRASEISHGPLEAVPDFGGEFFLRIPGPSLGGAAGYVQVVEDDGSRIRQRGENIAIPINDHVLGAARGDDGSFFYDTHVSGTHLRVFTFPGRPGYAIQVARPLTEVDDSLARIKTLLIVIALAGIAVAMGLGFLVSRAAVAPVTRLTEATERVTETGDLSERIDAHGQDELSRLAGSFNTMLAALEDSARAQRQLVADASHELRTPLTSLRTNFEVLMSERELPPEERRRLLDDVVEQIAEMTTLIAGLIELARGDQHPNEPEDVRLDLLTAGAVERIGRHRPNVTFTTELNTSVVNGVPASLERAIANLLDNAAKWSPPGGEVEVRVADGTVVVRDHGPGIEEEDLPFVFDRFYRSRAARTLPGSGLGLAIVRQVAESHGGSVVAERAEGGGTRMILRLRARRELKPAGADLVTADS